MQRLFFLIIKTIFNDNGIVAFTNFATLFLLGLSLSPCIFNKSRWGGWVGDIRRDIILNTQHV
jgi:hypothetical protein